ncbi:TMV resistance protein N-like [Senna tora]|uniref:TMV resistance protein N-like n=1 Tax=Senna tora TaxID=362788 RepID=A0A834T674_9FABA|nr:TMV resistance protein N-like [Senna tora]
MYLEACLPSVSIDFAMVTELILLGRILSFEAISLILGLKSLHCHSTIVFRRPRACHVYFSLGFISYHHMKGFIHRWSEALIVENIAEAIWTKLSVRIPCDFDYLVGVQPKVDKLISLLKGTKKIQSIVLKSHEPYQANWHPDCFSKMHNLILLYLSNVHLSRSLNSLPGGLKVLIWDEYALQNLPSIDQLYDLVHIQLRRSKIKQLWNGTMFLDRLKIINLSYSQALTEMSDFSGIPNLESLLLECCINLVTLHESLGQLKKLIKLNLKDCKNLVTLPRKLEMNCLEEFVLSGCSKLEKLPEFGENMKRLSMWDVSETNIKEIPSTIVSLMGLKTLSLHGCKSLALKSWSLSIFSENKFCSLKQLDLSFCNLHDGSLPHDLSGLSSLVELNLCGNEFVNPPSRCLYNLLNLERLELWGCFRLQSMPKLPPNLLVVDAGSCPSMKPLLDMQNLFASVVSKHRSLLLYEVIFLLISGHEIPTWFKKQNHHDVHCDYLRTTVNILVDVPYVRDKREWSGIGVCLALDADAGKGGAIRWKFKAPKEDQYYVNRFLSGGSRQLQLEIVVPKPLELRDCGWRMMCKKDFEACSATSTSTSTVQIMEIV